MPVVVSEKFDSFVKDAVASGRYRSETEVVEDALRLLRARCEQLDRLRADVEVGLADLDAGRCGSLAIEDIVADGQKHLNASTQ